MRPPAASTAFRASRLILGTLLGLGGHALAFGVGLLAGRLVRPSPGGGFDDVAAAVASFLVAEAVVLIACLIGGVVLIARGRRDLGAGLILGWVLGAIAGWAFIALRRT